MGFSLNTTVQIGKLGKDGVSTVINDKTTVTKFSIATNHSVKGADGKWTEVTTWHNVIAFNVPDFFKGLLIKGKLFAVSGRISNREYQKDGATKYISEIVANELVPCFDIPKNANGVSAGNGVALVQPEAITTGQDDDLPF